MKIYVFNDRIIIKDRKEEYTFTECILLLTTSQENWEETKEEFRHLEFTENGFFTEISENIITYSYDKKIVAVYDESEFEVIPMGITFEEAEKRRKEVPYEDLLK